MVGKRFIFVLILKLLFLLKETSSEVSILLIIVTSAISCLVCRAGRVRQDLALLKWDPIKLTGQPSSHVNQISKTYKNNIHVQDQISALASRASQTNQS